MKRVHKRLLNPRYSCDSVFLELELRLILMVLRFNDRNCEEQNLRIVVNEKNTDILLNQEFSTG